MWYVQSALFKNFEILLIELSINQRKLTFNNLSLLISIYFRYIKIRYKSLKYNNWYKKSVI